MLDPFRLTLYETSGVGEKVISRESRVVHSDFKIKLLCFKYFKS